MKFPLYQVDAFTSKLFGGNPAAIVPLTEWLPDKTLQQIAAENNLAETAYFIPQNGGYHLRWFTPTVEMDLCGHATLASALVLYECLAYSRDRVDFETRSGRLSVSRHDGIYWLDFPARPPKPVAAKAAHIAAVGGSPREVLAARDHVLVYGSEAEVLALNPRITALDEMKDIVATIATAPGDDCDFVSRFFAPVLGVAEDPVTGSAHCELIPYWAAKLSKTKMRAKQVSPRGGELFCELHGDRVRIGGHGVLYLEGAITIR